MDTRQERIGRPRALINHVCRWGSDGYPVYKVGRRWGWGPFRSVIGPPSLFGTKREAVASFEAFYDILLEALGEEAQARAVEFVPQPYLGHGPRYNARKEIA